MKRILSFIMAFSLLVFGCKENAKVEISSEHDHEHEEVKFQYTSYSESLEYFAEADPFVLGEESNILSHFTWLSNFKPLENAKITLKLQVNTSEVSETLEGSDRPGIYSFNLQPEIAGSGKLVYEIQSGNEIYKVEVPGITVFQDDEAAHEAAEEAEISSVNTSVFTKEQSWKIDFCTELPANEPFGQVIKTVAQVQSAPSDEMTLTAKSNGMVQFLSNNLVEGKTVSENENLMSISGNQLAVNNSAVMYAEAKNNYETSKLDYERKQELAKEKIVSEKDLLEAKNKYENARVIYQNLENNFNDRGEIVKSPSGGYIRQMFVKNGDYVNPGQALATITRNRGFMLHAEIQPKYRESMNHYSDAVIRTMGSNITYDLKDLDGKLIASGNSASEGNFMIPVHLRTDASANLIPGDFVELYLKTASEENKLVVPNSALLEEQGYFFVYVQLTPELFEKREVKTGETDGLSTEIKSGISANERIVTQGAMFIKLSQATGALDPHAGHVH
ncbi:efflux RND transporter periplasmic adaptor subunit [Maribellus sp. YY47]|uniref:efflux RND transporter periplasmic adaptor subunit n=1 Tax=Maribellus sp. YY47 TaxID=2929486 RepID=UPI002000F4DB|nr:efflux RND transporter periplasmic adaptor subunit [Maribellus sp. YY47]MCK3686047.1 efflux RND transporter periplasmic adaptor subunit [Maribellus sp. YY47]